MRVRCVGLKAFSAAIDLHYSLTISLAPPLALALGAAVVEQGPTGVHVLRLHASTHGIALVGMYVAVSAGAFIAHRPALNTDGWQSKTDEEVNDGSPRSIELKQRPSPSPSPSTPSLKVFFSGWPSAYRPRTVQQVRAEIGPLLREKFI